MSFYTMKTPLPNVENGENVSFRTAGIATCVYMCATKYPLWRFTVNGSGSEVTVKADGEVLGFITHEYQGEYKIGVKNHRVEAARQRGDTYKTTDPKKAFDKVRKTFGRLTSGELLVRALDKAKGKLNECVHSADYHLRQANSKHNEALLQFAKTPEIYELFVARRAHDESVDNLLAMVEDTRTTHRTLSDIREEFGTDRSALVIKDDTDYIVRIRDDVKIYSDGTLPAEIRAKLGMLKLVDNAKAIEGFGFRVQDDVYVVTLGGTDE